MKFTAHNILLKVKHLVIIFRIGIFIMCLLNTLSYGQSDHYWTQNFNTESSLMAGSVVGGNAGPSAIYYNPALINQDGSHKFALSANLFSFHSMKLENLVGEGTIYDNLVLKVQPKFISYSGSPKKNPKLTYEFAFLVPLTTDVRFNYLYRQEIDILTRLDGMEDYMGNIAYKVAYDDYYLGGGISFALSDQFIIGTSAFFSLKTLKYKYTATLKAMQNSDTVYVQGIPESFYFAENTSNEELTYSDLSLLFKLGVHYTSQNGNWGIGLKLSTPNLHIYGQGDVLKEYFRSNVYDNSTDQFTPNLSFSGFQLDADTKIKDPLSIAFGLQYKTPNRQNSILFTTEYFTAIQPYSMLQITNTEVVGNMQIENLAEAMTFYTSAQEVLNIGLGFIQQVNDNFTINGGFKTDFNALYSHREKTEDEFWYNPRLSEIYFDKFHFVAGPSVTFKRVGIILGIQFTMGRKKDIYQLFNLTDPVEYDPITHLSLQGPYQNTMNLKYNEISIFFGITYVTKN